MKFNNDVGASGVVAGLMIFIIVVVGILSFIMISVSFDRQYNQSISDPINSTGIMLNGSGSYESVKGIMTSASNSAPAAIFLALLIAITIIVLAIWAILKRGGD
jgi:flagellar biogenesis protein FliO